MDLEVSPMLICFPMGIGDFCFFYIIGGETIIFEVFLCMVFTKLAVFFSPLPVSVCKLSISCNSVFPLFFGVEKLICFIAMHLAPSIYQDLTVSWWNVFVFVWIRLTHEVLTNFIGYMGQRRSSWSKKTAIFDSLTHFSHPMRLLCWE